MKGAEAEDAAKRSGWERAGRIADRIDNGLMTLVRYLAVILLVCNAYVLLDTYYISRAAFTSYDLLQYKPKAEKDGDGLNGFADLVDLNQDAVGWLTVYDTNIDYPVVQGRDNFEYANKSIYGESSLTGAIYLDSQADGFRDWYSIIYGHHMENGAMFGDIDRFAEGTFLKENHDGYLQTPDGNYRLTIFACISTDAYEDLIYHYPDVEGLDEEKKAELADYIQANALSTYGDYLEKDLSTVHKLVLMSTCEARATYGRMVLFADAVPGTGRPERLVETPFFTAIGHFSDSEHWAVVNLIAFIAVILALLDGAARAIRRRRRADILGAAGEAVLLVVSAWIFMKTENLTKPMIVADRYTAVMFLLMVAAFLLGVLIRKGRNQKIS